MKNRICLSLLLILLVAATANAVPVTDGLIVHLRAEDLNLADGATVTTWPDVAVTDTVDGTVLSVSGQDDPTFKASGYNGLPAVSFDDSLGGQALVSNLYTWDETQGFTVIFFCTGGVNDSNDRAVTVGDRGGLAGANVSFDISGNDDLAEGRGSGARYNNGWVLTSDVAANPVVPAQWQTYIYQMAQSSSYGSGLFFAIDDLTPIVLESNNPSNVLALQAGNNAIFVGNGVNTSGNWLGDGYRGDMAEILIYNSQLTMAQMEEVLDFLNKKYAKQTAHNPVPSTGSTGQGTPVGMQVEVDLTWNTGLDSTGSGPNGLIGQHNLYVTTDPSFPVGLSPTVVPAGSPVEATGSYTATLEMDSTYYWRVDEVVFDPDPNIVPGPVWMFETRRSVPIINEPLADEIVEAGETATFTVDVTSISEPSYEWFSSDDRSADTPGDDTSLGTDAELAIEDVQVEDETFVYCVVTNTGGEARTNAAGVAVKRQVARWTLDLGDYVGGQYLDSSGEGHHADPNVHPDPSYFVPGAGASSGEALDTTIEPLVAADAGSWEPSLYSGEMTLSTWIRPVFGARMGVVTKRVDPEGMSWVMQIWQAGSMDFRNPGIEVHAAADLGAYDGQWVHVLITATPESVKVYVDGVLTDTTDGWEPPDTTSSILIGANNKTDGAMSTTFNGALDEIQIYNYAMDEVEVVEQCYYPVSEIPVCLYRPAFDWAGGGAAGDEPDCQVNLADFAAMVTEWLECGTLPSFLCD